MMEKLMEILEELRPDIEFEKEKALIDDHVLESLDIVTLVAELCDAFDIEMNPAELIPENFNSVESMWKMIERLQDE